MSLPTPVTGPERCPECDGKRVKLIGSGRAIEPKDRIRESVFLWDEGGALPYGCCAACGGSGLASDAMVRTLLK